MPGVCLAKVKLGWNERHVVIPPEKESLFDDIVRSHILEDNRCLRDDSTANTDIAVLSNDWLRFFHMLIELRG